MSSLTRSSMEVRTFQADIILLSMSLSLSFMLNSGNPHLIMILADDSCSSFSVALHHMDKPTTENSAWDRNFIGIWIVGGEEDHICSGNFLMQSSPSSSDTCIPCYSPNPHLQNHLTLHWQHILGYGNRDAIRHICPERRLVHLNYNHYESLQQIFRTKGSVLSCVPFPVKSQNVLQKSDTTKYKHLGNPNFLLVFSE